ncbi:YwaF family protein [Paenibacillus abyssi]|uniref:TIGR02206 family membrane protein n=1 Tax=Paenibacillus abyssi TaxID=1340531 RepID=A0A917LGF1_9BACL|nr:TIGR02206 family membrane protein [Paenibacillus abyssi]GGG21103.1 hypothetical protein GCM10010916_42300 [Paenibacillus abyssi]
MDPFFGPNGPGFIPYSPQHAVALATLGIVLVSLVIFRQWLKHPKRARVFRYGMAGLLLALHGLLHVWYVRAERWTWDESLPLQLCTVTLILSAVLLLYRNYRLYEFIYFAGIGGALQALFTPVLNVGFPHFWYLYFFIGHGGIIVTAIYMTAVDGYRPGWMSILRTMVWLNVLLLIVYPINVWTGGNYLFVSRKPQTASLLDLLGPWPWYLLWLELVALALFVVLYMPFVVEKAVRRRKQKKRLNA